MRTTVAIDDQLLNAAKRRARQRGLTLGQLIEEALRAELASRTTELPAPEIPVVHGSGGLRPGIDTSSNRALYEALDEGQPLEKLR